MKLIDLDNQTALTVDMHLLEEIAVSLTSKEIELIITDNSTIIELNSEHRGKESPTDVLSFPLDNFFRGQSLNNMPLGSIVISEDFVKEKAAHFGHTQNDELSLLFIHGLLHLLGFDHENDEGEMRKKEKEIIESFSLPSSLILRTEEF